MSFNFTYAESGKLTLEEAVFQALGAASTAWENREALAVAGTFDSGRAAEIGEALLEYLREEWAPTQGFVEASPDQLGAKVKEAREANRIQPTPKTL